MKKSILIAIVVAACGAAFLNPDPRVLAEKSLSDKALTSLDHYFAAWGSADEDERRKHLEAGWAEKGTYTDPTADVRSREELVQHIGSFASSPQAKNFSIERSSGIEIHHQVFRFEWEMRNATGAVLTKGFDYGEFDDNGMITKIVGFFGPFPKMKE